jgi:spermidine synthase
MLESPLPPLRIDPRSRSLLWAGLAALAIGKLLGLTGITTPSGSPPPFFGFVDTVFFTSALLGLFVLHVASRPPRTELIAAIASGGIAAIAILLLRRSVNPRSVLIIFNSLSQGLGPASALFLLARTLAANSPNLRESARATLIPGLLLPTFVAASLFFIDLTSALHPTTLDYVIYRVDAAFGGQLSFALGRLFAGAPILKAAATLAYLILPLGFAAIYSAHLHRRRLYRADVLRAFMWVGITGFALYHLVPVAGPIYAFRSAYPAAPPDPAALSTALPLIPPIPRNCVPSLHTAWALLIFWHSRPFRWPARALALGFLLLTLLATLGLGLHYAFDLVVAFPFTLAVHAAITSARQRRRTAVLAASSAMAAAWLMAVRFAPERVLALGPLALALAAATVLVSIALEAHLAPLAFEPLRPEDPVLARPARAAARLADIPVAAVFFFSGLAGLAYEVAFAKGLALTFGSAATASATVLSTYMGGIAAGSWLGGRWASRAVRPLKLYAYCELGIAAWCATSPWLLRALQGLYAAVAQGRDPASPWLVPVQVVFGSIALLPPTILMGMTLPLLTRHLSEGEPRLGRVIGLLYGSNTLGAALGALGTGYLLLPSLGLAHTTWAAVVCNLAVALIALRVAERFRNGPALPASTPPPEASEAQPGQVRSAGILALAWLAAGGAASLALENAYIHLLAVVAGNSAYAFSLMLFSFLTGLGAGNSAAGAWLNGRRASPLALAWLASGLALAILGSVFAWDAIPSYFAEFERYPLARTFAARELIRASVCFLIMAPTSFFIGAAYPIAMESVALAWPSQRIRTIGYAAALNTFGNVLGTLVGGFALLPALGSLRTLHVLAALTATLGLLAGLLARPRSPALAPLALVALAGLAQPRSFDLTRLASGTNVYFAAQAYGSVIDYAESIDGGLTTVATARHGGEAPEVLTLLTNGKFQGDNSVHREMAAQVGFALLPLLHTPSRGRALVIGLGTGTSARVLADAGFSALDVAELSGDIARMARRYFGSVNGGVLDRPGIHLHVTDGRNFLLLTRERYDLISMEVSSIWFSGAASLYSRDFYRLARQRLSDRGVLQQWVQLHHLYPEDVASVLASLRSEFSHVWLYYAATQGVLVACNRECAPDRASLKALQDQEPLRYAAELLGGSPSELLRTRILDPQAVDRYLESFAQDAHTPIESFVSDDDNLRLEYSTPRGNVRPYTNSLRQNLALLNVFQPSSRFAGTHLEESDEAALAPRQPGALP